MVIVYLEIDITVKTECGDKILTKRIVGKHGGINSIQSTVNLSFV